MKQVKLLFLLIITLTLIGCANKVEICKEQGFNKYEVRETDEEEWEACCTAKTDDCPNVCVNFEEAKIKNIEEWKFPPC